ncbi:MAG: DUF86 domain-containing protein [Desulfobacterales bacterium]|nr:DUF86 domain-containing protein [Desulfobacterales bacterium]
MIPEFSGIERRLDELNERLARLAPFREKKRSDFEEDAYLRDIVERNLEIAAQCCIDISHRIISLEKAQKPRDYYEAIIRMGELGVLPFEFARKLAPIAGFRNIMVHEYLSINWDEVHKQLGEADDLIYFADLVRDWLRKKNANSR